MIKYEFWQESVGRENDVEEINLLLKQLSNRLRKISDRDLKEIGQGARLLVARENNQKIIGMATLVVVRIPTNFLGRIEDVVVSKTHRGKGIGKRLINRLLSEAKKLKLAKVDLTCRPTRIEANKMYQKIGFENVDTNLYRYKLN